MTREVDIFCRRCKGVAERTGSYGAGADSTATRTLFCLECFIVRPYDEAAKVADAHFTLGVRYDPDPRNPIPVLLGELGSSLVNDGEDGISASELPGFVLIEV